MPDLIPGGEPVVGAADGFAANDFDVVATFEFRHFVNRIDFDGDGDRAGEDVGLDPIEVEQRVFRAFLDHLAGANGRDLPGGEA